MAIDRDRIFELLAGGPPQGLQPAEIGRALGLDRGRATQVRDLLQRMVRAGVVVRDGRRYRLQPKVVTVAEAVTESTVGVLHVSASGRGVVDRGEAYEGIRIARDDVGGAIDGDTVEVEVWHGRRGREEGRVVRVVERGRVRVTGELEGPPWRLSLDDARLPREAQVTEVGQARSGQAVLARIVRYPSRAGGELQVAISQVLGEPGNLLTEVAKVLAAQGVREDFPAAVEQQVASLPEEIRQTDLIDRVDLRDRAFVTIDPLTARDFDDAVAFEDAGDFTRVWVAVADVSHYVAEGSAVDREARRRGCSLYLPDRAVPMLPARLSSGICSLVPDKDRLAMVVRLDLAGGGQLRGAECMAAVIHSRGRLDYGGVAAALEGDFRGRRAGYREHAEQLASLSRVAGALRARRLERGSLDLDLPEARVVLDEDDPERVRNVLATRGDAPVKRAYNLIEELMIAANEAVASIFEGAGQPTIWRVHPTPDDDGLHRLAGWLAAYGVQATAAQLRSSRGVAELLRRLRDHPASRPLNYLVLRTLKQASYHVENRGHFGLASRAYLHFTSPIRRYPDLQVHRLVKGWLREQGRPAGGRRTVGQVPLRALRPVAAEGSTRERQALEVERAVHSLYAAALMRDRIGDEYWGTVVGLTRFGIYVSVDEPFVEGLIRFDSLTEWMEFDPERMKIYGGDSGRVVSLGDHLRVRVVDASPARRQIDLELLEWGESLVPAPSWQPPPQARRPRGRARHPRRRKRR